MKKKSPSLWSLYSNVRDRENKQLDSVKCAGAEVAMVNRKQDAGSGGEMAA